MSINKNEIVVIGVLCRPPNGKLKEFEDKIENLLEKIANENKLSYLIGDFNIDMLKMNQTLSTDNFMHQFFRILYALS